MRLLLVGSLLLPATAGVSSAGTSSQPNQNQAAGNDPWYAPDVYDAQSPGMTQPELVKETKPNYTGEAMRARIEGTIRLEGIVEVDGSVGPIRVRHSLDAVNGLDDEAVKTLRRWRFKPGRKDGVPVRTRIAVDFSFALRGSSPDLPVTGWPEDFAVKRSEPETSSDRLAAEVLSFADVRIGMKYPRDWAVVKGVSGELITVQRMDGLEARACTLLSPKPSEMDLMVPVRNDALRAFENSLRMEIASDPSGIELKRVGQIGASHLWIWSEMWRRGVDISGVPAANAAQLQSTFDGMRIWRFTTTDSHHELNIVCYVLTPRGSSKDGLQDTLQRAGEDFAGILNAVTVRPR